MINEMLLELDKKVDKAVKTITDLIYRGKFLHLALSGGKDSSVLSTLFYMAVKNTKANPSAVTYIGQRHHIISSNTTIENPKVVNAYKTIHISMEEAAKLEELPIDVHEVLPPITEQYVVSTIGKGKLPSFAGNSHDCAVSWKIRPQETLVNKLKQQSCEGIVSLIGNRYEESAARESSMLERGESIDTISINDNGFESLSPIADWSLNDVFLFLNHAGKNKRYESYMDNFDSVMEFYREANNDTCMIVLGEGGTNRSACGARSGCTFCQVSGDSDKSMESLLEKEENQYLEGLNKFREFVAATRFDWSRREYVGRQITKAGHYKLQPNQYSFEMRREMLRYLLTLDVIEEARAEEMENKLIGGEVEDNEYNRRMSSPQFKLVSRAQLIAIEFYWGLLADGMHAFEALSCWHEVRVLGRRYDIPELPKVAKTTTPTARYVDLNTLPNTFADIGLRDPFDEHVYDDTDVCGTQKDRSRDSILIRHEFGNSLTVCKEATDELFDWFIHGGGWQLCQSYCVAEGVKLLLSRNVVSIRKGGIKRYDKIARRGQRLYHLRERLNLSRKQFNDYLFSHSISLSEHSARLPNKSEDKLVCNSTSLPLQFTEQLSMFEAI